MYRAASAGAHRRTSQRSQLQGGCRSAASAGCTRTRWIRPRCRSAGLPAPESGPRPAQLHRHQLPERQLQVAGSRPACGTPLAAAPSAGKRTPHGGTLNYTTPRDVTLGVLGVPATSRTSTCMSGSARGMGFDIAKRPLRFGARSITVPSRVPCISPLPPPEPSMLSSWHRRSPEPVTRRRRPHRGGGRS